MKNLIITMKACTKKAFTKKAMPFMMALALATVTLVPGSGLAQEDYQDRNSHNSDQGFYLGINTGFGGNFLSYHKDKESIMEDPKGGAMGSFRVGYAFSTEFALSLEAHGYGRGEEESDELGLGASVLAMTWHPGGTGFFVRGGVGGGGGKFLQPETGEKVDLSGRLAGLFSLGYEWRLGKKTSLGMSWDNIGVMANGASGFNDDLVGFSGLTAQFSYRLY